MQLLRLTHWALLFVIAAMLSLAAAADTPDGGSQVVPSTEAENVEWSRSPTEVGERTGVQNVCISADFAVRAVKAAPVPQAIVAKLQQ